MCAMLVGMWTGWAPGAVAIVAIVAIVAMALEDQRCGAKKIHKDPQRERGAFS
jgi:hypothetical protein